MPVPYVEHDSDDLELGLAVNSTIDYTIQPCSFDLSDTEVGLPSDNQQVYIKLGTDKRKHNFNCPECGIDGLTKDDLSKHYNIYHSAEATKKRAN